MKKYYLILLIVGLGILSSCKKEYQCLSCDNPENQKIIEAKNEEEALKMCKDINCSQAFKSPLK